MPTRRYKPSGKSGSGAVPVVLGAALIGGVLVGAAEGFISQWFSLLLVFPAAVGAAAGGLASAQIAKRKMRAPLLAGSLAALAGVAGYATVHLVEYARFRSALEKAIEKRQAISGHAAEAIDHFLSESTGSPGFVGYMKWKAKQGTSIKRASDSGKGIEVSGSGSYVLWALELLFATIIAGAIAFERARQPFCEPCNRWFDMKQNIATGSAEKADVAAVLRALEARDMPQVSTALGAPSPKAVSIMLIERCSQCLDHEPQLTLQVIKNRQRKPSTHYRTVLLPEEAKALLDAIAARAKASEPE